MSSQDISDPVILVCQGRSCRKDRSPQVLKAFQDFKTSDIKIMACNCLGKCGNGPMVLILPEKIWYYQVRPQAVSTIIRKLKGTETLHC